MQKRLCGREQEFGTRILRNPGQISEIEEREINQISRHGSGEGDYPSSNPNLSEIQRSLIIIAALRKIADTVRSLGGSVFFRDGKTWLSNGAMTWKDSLLLEFANAESLVGSLDGVLQEKASERLIEEALKVVAAERELKDLSFYKNTVGPEGVSKWKELSYSSHHNYSYEIGRKEKVFRLMRHFLPVSLPFSGSGHLGHNKGGAVVYLLSQRALHTQLLQNMGSSYGNRPLVNIRDENLMAKESLLNRLHVVSQDATRCELQTWLVDIMTHLVIRLAEETEWELPPEWRLIDPLAEFHRINFSLENNLDYKAACGFIREEIRRQDLLDCNEVYLNAAKQLNPLSEEEKRGLAEWQRVLELLRARAFDQLVGELDWATKRFLLNTRMKKYGFGLDSIKAWRINFNYHNISSSPDKSWFARLDEAGYIKHLVTEEAIKRAMLFPPATRAKSRSDFIKLCSDHKGLAEQVTSFDWEKAGIQRARNESTETVYVCFGEPDNPFSPESSSLQKFLKENDFGDQASPA